MSSYLFPFDQASWGRVDQGVDFTGSGAIRAIGTAQIVRTSAPGWPNGGAGPAGQGIVYRLEDGPHAGRYVYVYEGIRPTPFRVGQIVGAGTPIGTFVPGSSIEIGWADSEGVPLSHSIYHEGMQTPAGEKFRAFLKGLSPAGSDVTHPTAGSVVKNYAEGVGGAIGGAALGIAKEILTALWNLFGQDGARILLYLALVLGGGVLAFYGSARAVGVNAPRPSSLAKLGAAAVPK